MQHAWAYLAKRSCGPRVHNKKSRMCVNVRNAHVECRNRHQRKDMVCTYLRIDSLANSKDANPNPSPNTNPSLLKHLINSSLVHTLPIPQISRKYIRSFESYSTD